MINPCAESGAAALLPPPPPRPSTLLCEDGTITSVSAMHTNQPWSSSYSRFYPVFLSLFGCKTFAYLSMLLVARISSSTTCSLRFMLSSSRSVVKIIPISRPFKTQRVCASEKANDNNTPVQGTPVRCSIVSIRGQAWLGGYRTLRNKRRISSRVIIVRRGPQQGPLKTLRVPPITFFWPASSLPDCQKQDYE